MLAIVIAVCVIAALRAARAVREYRWCAPIRADVVGAPAVCILPRATHQICDALVHIRVAGLYHIESASEHVHTPIFGATGPIFITGRHAGGAIYKILHLCRGDTLDVALHGAKFKISHIF